MDNLFETESETIDKEAENYKCAICKKMYINNTELIEHMELCDVEENKESEEDGEHISCPYCQDLFSNSKKVLKHMKVHWHAKETVSAFCQELFSQSECIMMHMEEH